MKMIVKVRSDCQSTANIRKILCMEVVDCLSRLVKSFIIVTQAFCLAIFIFIIYLFPVSIKIMIYILSFSL